MLVKDVYFDALLYEETGLAHLIHHLITERKVSLEDPLASLDFAQADMEAVTEMIHRNRLGFHKMNVYSLKMNQKTYVFIFAANEQEAVDYFANNFHQPAINCREILLDYEITRGNEVTTFRTLRKDYEKFPVIVGYFEKY
jgi:CheY-like chemotaxis protein